MRPCAPSSRLLRVFAKRRHFRLILAVVVMGALPPISSPKQPSRRCAPPIEAGVFACFDGHGHWRPFAGPLAEQAGYGELRVFEKKRRFCLSGTCS